MKLIRIFLLSLLMTFLIMPVQAKNNPDFLAPTLKINLPSRTIELFMGNKPIKKYPIAIGKPSTPTPLGNYNTISKDINPTWYPPNENYFVPSGPANPLGYRWMGFFGNYGIHGTNAPWSIGYAISNGCIRMHEEDVEELFEVVPYGTPIKITYERFSIRTNSRNQVVMEAYPDVYSYGEISLSEVYKKLEMYNLNDFISDKVLKSIIAAENEKPVVLAEFFNIKINNTLLVERGIKINNKTYLPLNAITEVLKLPLNYNTPKNTVKINNISMSVHGKSGNYYVTKDELSKLGGYHTLNTLSNCLESIIPILYINGKPITTNIRMAKETLSVPVKPIIKTFENEGNWNLIQKEIFKIKQPIANQSTTTPFADLQTLLKQYKAYVYYDPKAHRIDVTYSFQMYKGND